MSLNAERNGHQYPPYIYEVSREKVREYAQATFVPDGAVDDTRVPPTFAACITGRVIPMVVDDPELDGHWNLLHTGQEFEFHRSVRIHQILRCSPRITDITSRRSMDLLTVAVEVTDVDDGEPVLTASSTLVFFDKQSD